jgi:hypothetical protein
VIAGGVWWLREALLSGGLHTGSLSLVAPQLVAGIGMGMLIAAPVRLRPGIGHRR